MCSAGTHGVGTPKWQWGQQVWVEGEDRAVNTGTVQE